MNLVDGGSKKECLVYSNDPFKYQVERKWETKEWVDQYDVAEDKKTPVQSIQERVHHIKTDTQEKEISSMYDTITKFTHNVWLSHLRTLLDSSGHIHSGQVKEDVIEVLRDQKTGRLSDDGHLLKTCPPDDVSFPQRPDTLDACQEITSC
jgi:hypothetical protein